MDCERCSGQMIYENFYGWESDAVWFYPGWRCVHCGEVVDPVIYLNRRLNSQHFWKDEETPKETPALPMEVSTEATEVEDPVFASVGDAAEDNY